MDRKQIIYRDIAELIPYENNPRDNDKAVDAVAASIKEFHFQNPIIVDKDGVIVAGHTRLKAAIKLGLKKVPVIVADDLTEEQVKAFRLADNKTGELAEWDFEKLEEELRALDDIDMASFGFEEMAKKNHEWFERSERWDGSREEENESYNEFLDKFETKKTTDDCYTPENIYEVVAGWVSKEYGVDRKNFVRPFYPGGDYEAETYGPDAVVVDNPPFSILTKICRFYIENGIKFFLFAPTLTLFSADGPEICHIAADCDITYENGACVNTSFKTNLEDGIALRTAPELTYAVMEADAENTKSDRNLLKYAYPDCVVTAANVSAWSGWGIDFKVPRVAAKKITELDAMKERKLSIFGGGFLLSDLEAAKAAKAAKAAQEAGIPIEDINEDGEVVWTLSEREHEVVAELNAAQQAEN